MSSCIREYAVKSVRIEKGVATLRFSDNHEITLSTKMPSLSFEKPPWPWVVVDNDAKELITVYPHKPRGMYAG